MNKTLTGNKEAKDNNSKPRMSLIPREALLELAKALTAGEKKYGSHNWRKGIPISYLLDASIRHIYQFLEGENFDEETKTHHLGCAMANLSFAINMFYTNIDADDRFKPVPKENEITPVFLSVKEIKNGLSNKKIFKKTNESSKIRKIGI